MYQAPAPDVLHGYDRNHLAAKIKGTWPRLTDEDVTLYYEQPELFFNRLYALHGITKLAAEAHIHLMREPVVAPTLN